MEFSPDSTYLASGDRGYNVKVWDVATKQLHCQFKHSLNVWGIAFSPDGKSLAAVADGNGETFKIWDLDSQTQVKSWNAHSSHITGVSWSSCGKYLVSGGHDKKIRVWDAVSASEYRSFDEPTWTSDYSPVKFIPNTTSFVSGGQDGNVKVWNIETGMCIAHFTGHNQWVWSLDVSPCGRYIVAGDGSTNQVELYSMNGHIHSYQGHSNKSNCAAFSPCGKFIVSGGSWDKTILTWVNWKMLADDNLLDDGGDWAAKQYAQINHDGATIKGKTASALKG